MDGIRNAQVRRVHFGRKMTDQQCPELRQKRREGVLIKTLMEDYKLSKASVYCYLNGARVT